MFVNFVYYIMMHGNINIKYLQILLSKCSNYLELILRLNLILCNLYKNLCIKLVSIKEFYLELGEQLSSNLFNCYTL